MKELCYIRCGRTVRYSIGHAEEKTAMLFAGKLGVHNRYVTLFNCDGAPERMSSAFVLELFLKVA